MGDFGRGRAWSAGLGEQEADCRQRTEPLFWPRKFQVSRDVVIAGQDGIPGSGEIRRIMKLPMQGALSTMVTCLTIVFLQTTTVGYAQDGVDASEVTALVPVTSSSAPITTQFDIAIVSHEIACVIDSYESRIHCMNRDDGSVSVFGREGRGPGEFAGLTEIERGPGGQVAAIDIGEQRLTFFTADGALVSETRLPDSFKPRQLRVNELFGFRLEIANFTPTFVPMAADANTGEALWERTDLADAVGRECFSAAVGVSTPVGGLVYQVCGNELAFFAHRDAPTATVVASPGYVEALPNERDVTLHVDLIGSLSRRPGGMSESEIEAMAAEFRKTPKEWILKPGPFGFDDQNRLWVATTRNRDAYSYFDIWTGTEYAGAVRVRDRLMGFDIFGSTLVTLVERPLGDDGIGVLAIDWYDIGEVN